MSADGTRLLFLVERDPRTVGLIPDEQVHRNLYLRLFNGKVRGSGPP